jgi:hypothetical protein
MSLARCLKRILCDPDVTESQAIANAIEFLEQQSQAEYSDDPTEVLNLKTKLSDTVRPHMKKAIDEVVAKL